LTQLANQKPDFPGKEYPIMKIYVSNLPASSSNAGPARLFQPFGVITSAHVMTCGKSGHSRGFGYVDMVREGRERAVSHMNGEKTGGMLPGVRKARKRL